MTLSNLSVHNSSHLSVPHLSVGLCKHEEMQKGQQKDVGQKNETDLAMTKQLIASC